jgi:DNA-binding NtrC family response regulator
MTEGKRVRILNVEDEEVDHMALQRMVKEKGLLYDVDRAATLAEALEKLEGGSYDVVLIDYVMPDGTGLDLLEKIKGVPSIIITGRGDEAVAVKAMKGGAYDYIIKDPEGGYVELLPATIGQVLLIFHLAEEFKRADGALRESEEKLKKEIERLTERVRELEGKG